MWHSLTLNHTQPHQKTSIINPSEPSLDQAHQKTKPTTTIAHHAFHSRRCSLFTKSYSIYPCVLNLIILLVQFPLIQSDICKIILAIVLPPLGVFLERGCVADFWINILLTILGYIPGIIHALYIILKY
ncbi:hypothetical protein MJO28_013522 [Puccinia striiformis f. sp. tritici]|uniref:Plasma membrane proteolipid 3 n=2 Tax=Puccinia striiformis TaxID=27350 RepID=A0A2S4VT21_9BASI|nr:hypothetical protein Pst134EB_026575 [Puccinia striiformis f. sp. tritici]KAI7939870.1 hypothetical protein MJO28_013522 [Puccinia striiformis f. sp. tritici]POW12540.1 hypothetical protein PSHT_08062 [Puccinia striiformis]